MDRLRSEDLFRFANGVFRVWRGQTTIMTGTIESIRLGTNELTIQPSRFKEMGTSSQLEERTPRPCSFLLRNVTVVSDLRKNGLRIYYTMAGPLTIDLSVFIPPDPWKS